MSLYNIFITLKTNVQITNKSLIKQMSLSVTQDNVDGMDSSIEQTEPAIFMLRREEKKIIKHYGYIQAIRNNYIRETSQNS